MLLRFIVSRTLKYDLVTHGGIHSLIETTLVFIHGISLLGTSLNAPQLLFSVYVCFVF